jgi:diaminopimelate decarboxylase
MLELFPDTTRVDNGVVSIGGCSMPALANEFGTPLVVYCEETIRARVRAYRAALPPDGLVVYGTKAFANVAILRVLAEEGAGADVSTLGELAFAQRAGLDGDKLVFHGNNKSDEELAAAAAVGATVVVDSPDEPARAAAAGSRRILVRLTPGIAASTHAAIATAHEESKFGLGADGALQAIRDGREAGLDVAGVHVHIGSQLTRLDETLLAVDWLAAFCQRARDELDWMPAVVDLGGGLGIRYGLDDHAPDAAEFAQTIVSAWQRAWPEPVQLIVEPGRSLVGQAGVSLYRVGAVKQSGGVAWVAVDGGMSDNPRPQLYGAHFTGLLANRASEPATGPYRIAGKHCESGDVLIDRVELPKPHRDDVLAVAATGAYTLGMASNYNGIPRPAVVLVRDGEARLIRRRETLDDLLQYEENKG